MARLVSLRLLRAALTLLAVFTLVFFAARLSGDPVDYLEPDLATEEVRERWEAYLEIDRSWVDQYGAAIANMARGNFGYSYHQQRPVVRMYGERIGNTLALAAIAFALTIAVGIPLGILGAVRHGTAVGSAVMGASFLGYAIPNFILGILLILLFSAYLGLLPSSGIGTPAHYVMPALTLGLASAAGMARFTRSAMLDVLSQDFLRTARAKGAGERRVILGHGLRNASLPVLTLVGLQLGTLIAGSVVVENVFSWPGMGQLLVAGVERRDFPVVQFGVLVLAATVVVANAAIDVVYRLVDPRIRLDA